MKHLFSAFAAVLASLILLSCGGKPNDWGADSQSTVFVWKDNAWTEHPGVANSTDLGVPSSRIRVLVGKSMEMTYQEGNTNYILSTTFTSPMVCQVTTNAIGDAQRTDATASYLYEPLTETTAKLTIKFRIQATSCVCVTNLSFTAAVAANATISSFKSTANEDIVAPETTAIVTWNHNSTNSCSMSSNQTSSNSSRRQNDIAS